MQLLDERRAAVDEWLAAALPATGAHDPGRLCEAMRYAVLLGGKRMRPALAMAACEAAGGDPQRAVPLGAAVELVHAYSLVHDDLPAMDDDALRRGMPTVHVEFGEAAAILVGDALQTLAFELAARHAGARAAEAVVVLARHAGIAGMVGGQALDLELGADVGDLAALEQLHRLKTGGLYAAAGALGGVAADASPEVVTRLEAFGMAFGVAFQHADDVLDDEQPAVRAAAIARVAELAAQMQTIAADVAAAVPRGRADGLVGLAQWVVERIDAAARGEKRA
jgi:geranylgeranyl pyrophosphate synthase